jgi:hypothetical protein
VKGCVGVHSSHTEGYRWLYVITLLCRRLIASLIRQIPYFDMEAAENLKVHRTNLQRGQISLENVYSEPADLHIAQTLDRSYYLRLESTEDRDYDQVVYRYTNARSSRADNTDIVPNTPRQGVKEFIPSLLMVNRIWLWQIDARKSSSILHYNDS